MLRRHALTVRLLALSTFFTLTGANTSRSLEDEEPSPDYSALYTECSETSSFNVEVVRGMVLAPSGTEIYAINSYASSLVRYDLTSLEAPLQHSGEIPPNDVWPTLVDPVAVAMHGNDVLVLGQGTHGLARHDPVTGRIIDLFAPAGFSEPADLVVDEANDEAYVSCMGEDCVVRIDLSGPVMTELERWCSDAVNPGELALKRPRFLHWTGSELYVAPFVAGNNTTIVGNRGTAVQPLGSSIPGNGLDNMTIYDMYDANSPIVGDLPDVDLYRITPGAVGAATIEPIFADAGSLLTAHGVHPGTGEYWMLGIDARNTPLLTEPEHRGDFAKNTLVISPIPTAPNLPTQVTANVQDLDAPGGGPYSADDSLPFPWALEFDAANGIAAVASSTLSRVGIYDSAGVLQDTIPPATGSLHDGLVVRDLMFVNGVLLLYCQQTSNIVLWRIPNGTPADSALVSFTLLSDPTSEGVARGREVFYDARISENDRSTCGHCHPGGESDGLSWHLKDGVKDFKDPMVTQTLKGLRETFPYHWRAERELADFNGAFKGLLGNDTVLEDEDLADFEAFVFSLRPAANPHELLSRQLPAFLDVPGTGLPGDVRRAGETFAIRNCNECHMLPTGSAGSIQPDNAISSEGFVNWNANIETIQLSNFLQLREQPLFPLDVPDPPGTGLVTIMRPLLGAGWLHSGANPTLHSFIENKFGDVFASTPEQSGANGAAFVMSLDTGTPPAAHHAVVFDAATQGPASVDIQTILEAQAEAGWIDLVVRGTSPDPSAGNALTDYAWVYDPLQQRYLPDVSATSQSYPGVQQLNYFAQFSTYPTRRNVFFGVPKGHGERLGRDFDRDGLLNGDEPAFAWNRDRDGDGDPDGYEVVNGPPGAESDPNQVPSTSETDDPALVGNVDVLMTRATHAEFTFEADEEVTWELTATDLTGTYARTSSGSNLARKHTAHVHDLEFSDAGGGPLMRYDLSLTIWDRAGNDVTIVSPALFSTARDRGGFGTNDRVRVEELGFPSPVGNESHDPITMEYEATVRVLLDDYDQLFSNPVADWLVLAQILRQDAAGDWHAVTAADLLWHTGQNQDLSRVFGSNSYPIATGGPLIDMPLTGSLTGSDPGAARVTFRVANVAVDEPIGFNIVAILNSADDIGMAGQPVYPVATFDKWQMPATQDHLRMFVGNLP